MLIPATCAASIPRYTGAVSGGSATGGWFLSFPFWAAISLLVALIAWRVRDRAQVRRQVELRLAVQQRTGVRSRLMLDVSGHRQARREALSALARRTVGEVLSSGTSFRMDPMNPFERKIIHDTVAGIDGVESESEGEEPNRRVVVLPVQ